MELSNITIGSAKLIIILGIGSLIVKCIFPLILRQRIFDTTAEINSIRNILNSKIG